MKHLVLLYQDLSTMPSDAAGQDRLSAAYETFTQSARAANALIDGYPLVPMPDHVRTIAGGAVKNGAPEVRQQSLIGFYILDYPTLDAVVAAAQRIPTAASGSVEVIPFREMTS
jgi:hypothetical protein